MKARTRLILSVALLLVALALFWRSTPRNPQPAAAPVPAPAPSAMPPHDVAPPAAEATPARAAAPQPFPTATAPSASPSAPVVLSTPATPPLTDDEPAPAPPAPSPAADGDISADLERVDNALRDFRTVLGENPVGSNAEITRALLGDNLKQVKIGTPAGSSVNAEGELTDRWGTPYFFHQLSGAKMEIRSAGPDRAMWTRDDALIGKAPLEATAAAPIE